MGLNSGINRMKQRSGSCGMLKLNTAVLQWQDLLAIASMRMASVGRGPSRRRCRITSFEGLSAPAVWDAIPYASKIQILLVIGFFEFWSESSYVLEKDGTKHYMRGGKPGYFPTFNELPYPVPFNLFDPFGLTKKLSEEAKTKKLEAEINNGRLAMLGLFSLISEARVPGAVPALSGLIKPYSGDVMGPFSAADAKVPFVGNMLEFAKGLPWNK